MKSLLRIATSATLLAAASASWATDCHKWDDHKPGYCGVTSNDNQCAVAANRVPGKCSIPSASWFVDSGGNLINNATQSLTAAAGSFALLNPDGTAVPLVASGGGNLVASGGGNLVASGAGNMVGGRSLQSVGGKKVFVLKR